MRQQIKYTPKISIKLESRITSNIRRRYFVPTFAIAPRKHITSSKSNSRYPRRPRHFGPSRLPLRLPRRFELPRLGRFNSPFIPLPRGFLFLAPLVLPLAVAVTSLAKAKYYCHAARSLSMLEANLYEYQTAAFAAAGEAAKEEREAQGAKGSRGGWWMVGDLAIIN